jgi:iron complex outermembrane receptor protein
MSNRCSARLRLLAAAVIPLLLAGVAGATSATDAPNEAADAPGPAATPDNSSVGEVVVTAQKRTEVLKDVPISIQALGEDRISQAAVFDTRDLAAIAPTVNFTSGNSAYATSFSLRGVSSAAFQSGIQPSTAMVIDGVPVARQAEFISRLGDIERIEILNGPQGTLFGKNSTAGLISIVTKAPTAKYEGLLEALGTFDSEFGVRGMVNLPASEAVRIRVNAFYDHQKPLIKNLTGPDVLGARSYGANIKVGFDLADNLELLLSGTYAYTNSSAGQFVPLAPGIFGSLQTDILAGGTTCRCRPTVNTDVADKDIYETKNVSATLNWQLADSLDLTSITAFTRFDEHTSNDSDTTPAGITVGKGQSIPGSNYPFQAVYVGIDKRYPDAFHYLSQELRLNYNKGPTNAIVGAYVQDYHDESQLNIPLRLDGSVVGATPGTPYLLLNFPRFKIHDNTASVFADVTRALTGQFKIFGGLRYTREYVSDRYHRDDYFAPFSVYDVLTGAINAPPVQTVDADSTHRINNVSGRVGVQFEPTTDLNFYATYSRGFKGPAVDVSTSLLPGKDPIINPEIADAVEVGGKLRLLDNRLAINVALFDEKIKGIQVGVPEFSNLFNVVYINAGTLNTKGVEADVTWAANSKLRLNAGVAYDDATYGGFSYLCNSTQNANGTCPNDPVTGLQNVRGQQAIGAPKVKYLLGGNYSDMLPHSSIGYSLQVDWSWNSKIYYELGADPISLEPSHGMLNASVTFRGADDRWAVQVFGKNLTNELFFASLSDVALDGRPFGYLTRDYQRYGGVRLTLRY